MDASFWIILAVCFWNCAIGAAIGGVAVWKIMDSARDARIKEWADHVHRLECALLADSFPAANVYPEYGA